MNGRTIPRWPLLLIALPAAVAVWSGWVSLGQLCGFGLVHPLPGIWDAAVINTAVTLPIGMESYGAYALGAWLTPGTPQAARKFARWSATGALGLGMTGQVIYHLLNAAHAQRAPWPVVALVSCLPVIVLGFGAALTHLLRAEPAPVTAPVAAGGMPPAADYPLGRKPSGDGLPAAPNATVTAPDGATVNATAETPAVAPERAAYPASQAATGAPESAPETVPSDGHGTAPGKPGNAPVAVPRPSITGASGSAPKAVPGKTPKSAPKRPRGRTPEAVFAAELAAGSVPSQRRIRTELKVGQVKAQEIQRTLTASAAA